MQSRVCAYAEYVMSDTKSLQETLFEEMRHRIKEDDSSVPTREDDYYYYARTEKGKNYAIHCRKYQSIDAQEEIILDENQLASESSYFHLRGFETSPDHKLLAYSTDTSGYETYTIYIKDLATGEIIDTINDWVLDKSNLIITVGGTGLSPSDKTPEIISPLLDKELHAVVNLLMDYGFDRTFKSLISRPIAGLIDDTLIITIPGSSKGAKESMDALLPEILYLFKSIHHKG